MGWGEETALVGSTLFALMLSGAGRANYTEAACRWAPQVGHFHCTPGSLGSKLRKLFQEYLKGLNRNIGGPGTQRGREESPTKPPCPSRDLPG